ncbi:MAG: glycosyltransferase family 39 protein [Ruminococcus sp.]|nr:glycosyltransferase family 39 protein [Ruminococcus sp.]
MENKEYKNKIYEKFNLENIKQAVKRINYDSIVFIALITVFALIARVCLFPKESGDYHQFLLPWYNQLKDNGGIAAIGMNIGDYMPTYYYIMAILTYLPLSPLVAIKLVSCIADVILAIMMYKTVKHLTNSKNKSLVAYAVTLFLPSVILNSSAWGQCDSIYTLFIVLSLYSVLRGKSWRCMLYFSIAFMFKIQAVFFAPVILILLMKRKINTTFVLAFPLVYFVTIMPAVMAGANFLHLLTVYFRQAGQYKLLNMYIQNAWSILFEVTSPELSKAGVYFAGGIVLIAIFLVFRSKIELTNKNIVTLSALFVLLVPFVLPHMHERYYYPATIMALLFVMINPKKIWTLLIMEFCLFQAEAHNLFGKEALEFNFSIMLVTFVLVTYFKAVYDQIKKPAS